jgi:tRNA U54 and U55 pseudouridine synthase Pus10
LSLAKDLSKQLGKDDKKITEEMKSGNYENLLKVFDREFGNFVTLYR